MTHTIKIGQHHTIYISLHCQIVLGIGFVNQTVMGRSYVLITTWLGPFSISLERSVPVETPNVTPALSP